MIFEVPTLLHRDFEKRKGKGRKKRKRKKRADKFRGRVNKEKARTCLKIEPQGRTLHLSLPLRDKGILSLPLEVGCGGG